MVPRGARVIAALALAPDDVDGRRAFDDCLARGNQPTTALDRAECEQLVTSGMVGGRYCRGSVVMTIDPAGAKTKRCVPQEQVDAKLEASRRDPLPPRAPTSRAPLVLGGVALGVLAYVFLR